MADAFIGSLFKDIGHWLMDCWKAAALETLVDFAIPPPSLIQEHIKSSNYDCDIRL